MGCNPTVPASLPERDDDTGADIRLAMCQVDIELDPRVVQEPAVRVRACAMQMTLIEFEVSVVPDTLDEAIEGKRGRIEAVFGGLDLAFDG